jgi:peptide/nickel transport system ATP-binding protein
MVMLDVRDLKVYFQILKGTVKAVDGVSFTLDDGETMGLVGESGCGKTTTAFAVTQLLPGNGRIVGGEIEFEGKLVGHGDIAMEVHEALKGENWLAEVRAIVDRVGKELERHGADPEMTGEFHALIDLDLPVLKQLADILGQPGADQESEELKKRLNGVVGKLVKGGAGIRRHRRRQRMADKELRAIRWWKVSMIFQSAMNAFNPVYRIGDQICEALLVHKDKFQLFRCHKCKVDLPEDKEVAGPRGPLCPTCRSPVVHRGMTKKEARAKTLKLFDLVGIDRSRIDGYPHEFSGGMRQRSMIAMALACGPKLLIADEPTTALDVIMQDRILAEIRDLQKELGIAMIVITHDISVVAEVSQKIGIMYAGRLFEYGNIADIFEKPANPYTLGLMGAFPSIKGARKKLKSIPGSPPDLMRPPPGCAFHPRCPFAKDICKNAKPPIISVAPNHWSQCHFANEVYAGKLREAT